MGDVLYKGQSAERLGATGASLWSAATGHIRAGHGNLLRKRRIGGTLWVMSDRRGKPEPTERERAFLLALLRLHATERPGDELGRSLDALSEAVGARIGYVELRDESGDGESLCWESARGASDEELSHIRSRISSGIIAEAIATGTTLHTASALDDPRFEGFESVRAQAIEAVLCAPVGRDAPRGIVYMQGTRRPGPFEPDDERLVTLFADHLDRAASRLLGERIRRRAEQDGRPLLAVPGVPAVSRTMRDVLAKLALAATLDLHILFVGASGTGKSLLARSVHDHSAVASGPFVEINCATVPDNLFENELFGAAPGAHSAALRGGSEGKVAAAAGGTLFLDEIGELSASAQAKLLQLLQSKSYYRLGETKLRHSTARILAATNIDLDEAVAARRFREDLLYRLRVLEVKVPSLHDRQEDIVPLAHQCASEVCRRHGFGEIPLAPSALAALQTAEWPGNVRQLRHAIESAAVNARMSGASAIEATHLFPSEPPPGAAADGDASLQERLHVARGQIVAEVLAETDWNVSEAARRLDVARSYLYKLIQAHGLRREHKGPSA